MASNCNTPTFVVQTGTSRTLAPESESVLSFAEQTAQRNILFGAEGCCGTSEGEVVGTDFIWDGTYFFDGVKLFQ